MLLRTENLTKKYGSFCALEGLNLTVQPGEIFGLLGPNGSGKSTAIRLLLGFMKPTAGGAWINTHHCWKDSVQARKQVTYLPGELRLYENMTGWQLIRFLEDLRGGVLRKDLEDLAKTLDIDLNQPIAKLSSGMKRKVALLQVLAPHSPLMILDEPTNTLDPSMRDELLVQLSRAREQGQAVLFSSHVLSEVERICDRVGILRKGKLVHLLDMANLSQGRRISFDLEGDLNQVPDFPGLIDLQRQQHHMILEYDGEMSPLLRWLADYPVKNLKVESLGLTSIYKHYHGTEA